MLLWSGQVYAGDVGVASVDDEVVEVAEPPEPPEDAAGVDSDEELVLDVGTAVSVVVEKTLTAATVVRVEVVVVRVKACSVFVFEHGKQSIQGPQKD